MRKSEGESRGEQRDIRGGELKSSKEEEERRREEERSVRSNVDSFILRACAPHIAAFRHS
jgi:hypothetical protein